MTQRHSVKAILLFALCWAPQSDTAQAQSSGKKGSVNAPNPNAELQFLLNDLKSAESNLNNNGGVYQLSVPATQSDEQKNDYVRSKKTSPRELSEENGLVIVGEPESFKAAAAVAKKVAEIQSRDKELKAKIASIQDRLAEKFAGVVNLDLSATTRADSNPNIPSLGYVELSASLNGLPLVHYLQPSRLEKTDALPLFAGPVPPGEFEFQVSAMVGHLQHGWPYALAQGKWLVEKKFKIALDGKNKSARWQVVVLPSGMQGVPELVLEEIRSVVK